MTKPLLSRIWQSSRAIPAHAKPIDLTAAALGNGSQVCAASVEGRAFGSVESTPGTEGALAHEAARPRFNAENLRKLACVIVVACVAALSLVLTFSVRAQETARAKQLGTKLMCVCGCTQVLIYCNHVGCSYSHDMIKELDQAVARNESDDLTLQAFVQEYGPTVLASPPAKGFDLGVWIVPILAPILALYLVWEVVRRWRKRAALVPAGVAPHIAPELLDRARRETGDDAHD